LRTQFDRGEKPDEDGFRYVSMAAIEAALGYVPNKSEFDRDLKRLIAEPIGVNLLEKDGKEARYYASFLSEAKVSTNRIAFKFPSYLEGVMRGLEDSKAMFQLLNWSIFNHFSGKYEAVIYKLSKDYVGVSKTPYMTVEEFREYMGLKPAEYSRFNNLNLFVISGPCERINSSEVSDISVRPDYEREGRKVIGLRFLVSRKAQATIPFPELESSPVFRFSKIHIEPATQQEYLSLRPPEEIELCIERANEYAEEQKKAGKNTDLGAIYRKSISEGWHVSYLAKKKRKEAIAQESEKKISAAQAKESQEAAKAKEARARINEILTRFDALPDEEKTKLRADYLATLTASIVRKPFEKDGEKSPLHRVGFANFVSEIV
jgi:Initiator Replication protein